MVTLSVCTPSGAALPAQAQYVLPDPRGHPGDPVHPRQRTEGLDVSPWIQIWRVHEFGLPMPAAQVGQYHQDPERLRAK